MDAHGVDVLDEADGDLLVLRIPDDLELELLPADHRFLHQELADEAGRQTSVGHGAEFLDVVDQAAARSSHGVRGADDHRVAEVRGNLLRLFHCVGELAPGHVDAQAGHGGLEGFAILPTPDGVDVDADDFDAEAIENAGSRQLRAQVEARLAAEVREQRIRSLLLDDLGHPFRVQRLEVGHVRHAGVGHDGRRIGVGQDDLVAKRSEGLAGLGPRVVELTGLSDDNGPGTDDHHFSNVVPPGHGGFSSIVGSGDRWASLERECSLTAPGSPRASQQRDVVALAERLTGTSHTSRSGGHPVTLGRGRNLEATVQALQRESSAAPTATRSWNLSFFEP